MSAVQLIKYHGPPCFTPTFLWIISSKTIHWVCDRGFKIVKLNFFFFFFLFKFHTLNFNRTYKIIVFFIHEEHFVVLGALLSLWRVQCPATRMFLPQPLACSLSWCVLLATIVAGGMSWWSSLLAPLAFLILLILLVPPTLPQFQTDRRESWLELKVSLATNRPASWEAIP